MASGVPFDIYPEQSDEPPPNLVQPSLESLLGDLARNDPTKTAYQLAAKKRWQDILRRVGLALGTVFSLVLLGLYAVRYGRQLYFSRASASTQQRYRMLLDELATLDSVGKNGNTNGICSKIGVRVPIAQFAYARLSVIYIRSQ